MGRPRRGGQGTRAQTDPPAQHPPLEQIVQELRAEAARKDAEIAALRAQVAGLQQRAGASMQQVAQLFEAVQACAVEQAETLLDQGVSIDVRLCP